jgi:hypothetical protein
LHGKEIIYSLMFLCKKKGQNSYQCRKKERKKDKNKAEKTKGEKEDKTIQKGYSVTSSFINYCYGFQ